MLTILLWVAATAAAIASILMAVSSSLLFLVPGAVLVLLCIAMARVLEQQERLLENQDRILNSLRQITELDVQTCHFCGKTYGRKQASCPHCGRAADSEKE